MPCQICLTQSITKRALSGRHSCLQRQSWMNLLKTLLPSNGQKLKFSVLCQVRLQRAFFPFHSGPKVKAFKIKRLKVLAFILSVSKVSVSDTGQACCMLFLWIAQSAFLLFSLQTLMCKVVSQKFFHSSFQGKTFVVRCTCQISQGHMCVQ